METASEAMKGVGDSMAHASSVMREAKEMIDRLGAENERMRRECEALRYLHSILVDREDVRDGDAGRQLPNESMSILSEFAEKFPNLAYQLRHAKQS